MRTFYGSFSDKNGKRYEIEIVAENGTGNDVILTMGGSPVVITSSSDKLFAPIKSRSASLEIVSTDYYFELYEPSSRGTSIKIYEYDSTENNNQGTVIFRGYLTPCSYDQSFTYLDTITLEAVDAISTTKDWKWQNTGQYNSFLDIILTILNNDLYGYKGKLYVPQSYESINENTITGDVLDKLFISSSNFIDDNEEKTPWTEYEVLEEIMQFLGWSLCPFGDDVWLIDYRSENAGSTVYSEYDIRTSTLVGSYTSSNTETEITLDQMTGGTSQVSIDDIYNKIEISDNLYKIDEITPDIFDDGNHISITDEADLGVGQSKWSTIRRKKFLFWSWDSNNDKDYLEGTDYQTICRLKPESGWTHYYYKMSDLSGPLDNTNGQGYYNEATSLDANQKAWIEGADDETENGHPERKIIKYCNTHGCLLQHYAYVDESHPNNVPTSIDWTDILTFFVLGPTSTPVPLGQLNSRLEKKVLEYNINETIQWKPATGKSWITINGSLFYQNGTDYKDGKKTQRLSIVNSGKGWYATAPVDKSLTNLPSDMNYAGLSCTRSQSDTDYGKGFKLWKMGLHIGGMSWNGSAWVEDEEENVTFKISFNNNPDNENDEYIPAFQWMSIVSNTTYKDQVGEDCYAIPIDSEIDTDPSFGKLKLEIYTPNLAPDELIEKYEQWWGSAECGFGTLAPVIYCKDFEVGYVYTDTSVWWDNHSESNQTDKVYIGYINDNYIKDFDSLQFKINTSIPDKPISRSFVSTEDGYLGTMKHIVGDTDKEQEFNVVDLYLDHHSDRRVIFDANLHELHKPYEKFSSRYFYGKLMIDSYSYDVRDDNNSIKFIAF